jgi:glycosyltransferase involved in cell wall biosynthesis
MWQDAGRDDWVFDLVHATAFPYAWVMACGLRLARRLRIPFLVTPFLHLGDADDSGDRTRRAYLSPALLTLLQQADRIFVQTDVEHQALRQRGFPEEQLVLQGMGVDPADCTGGNRSRARATWEVDSTKVVVGHLANLSKEKGSIDLLKAADLAWKRGYRFHLILAGPEMTNFQNFWKKHVPAGPVRRLGVLSEEQKRDFFAGLDLFALPSRSDSFGLVFLEAWANGVPNLAYRAGGVPGVIRHGQDGLLVRCGAIQELAEALERLSADAALRRQLGEAGRQRLAGEFCWLDKLNLVRNQYAEVIGEFRRAEYRSHPARP